MSARQNQYEITWLVRRLFRAMTERSNEGLLSLGISAADRAVLEFLHPDQSLTVPAIADQYQVSRQHVQVTVNRLLDKRLVKTATNPNHRRSPLVKLTVSGRKLFATVLERDRRLLAKLFAGVPAASLETTRETLSQLLDRLGEGDA